MRSYPASHRLTFLLPPGATAVSGSYSSSADHGRSMVVTGGSFVEIDGASREAVFEHAAALLRVACKGRLPTSIAARLETPGHPGGGRDAWHIIVGADVAFSPSGIDPHLPILKEHELQTRSRCRVPAANENPEHAIRAASSSSQLPISAKSTIG